MLSRINATEYSSSARKRELNWILLPFCTLQANQDVAVISSLLGHSLQVDTFLYSTCDFDLT